MEQLSWTDDLRTGNALIDGDHRTLIDLVNAFCQAMTLSQASDVMGKTMDELVAYTKAHFAREEAEMQRIQYVALRAHTFEHAKLVKQVVELKGTLDAGGRLNVPAVASFLKDWLLDHIQTADIKLAKALKSQALTAK